MTTRWAARVLHWVAFTVAAPHVVHKQALMMDFLIRVMVPEEGHMCHCTVASWKAWQEQTHTRWETNRNVAKEALLSLHVMWHLQRKIKSLRWVVPRHSYSNTLCLIFLCFWRSHNNRETLTMSPHLKKLNKLEPIFNWSDLQVWWCASTEIYLKLYEIHAKIIKSSKPIYRG